MRFTDLVLLRLCWGFFGTLPVKNYADQRCQYLPACHENAMRMLHYTLYYVSLRGFFIPVVKNFSSRSYRIKTFHDYFYSTIR